MGLDGIGGWKNTSAPVPTGQGMNQALLGGIGTLNKSIGDLRQSIDGLAGSPAPEQPSPRDTSATAYPIDVTSAHTDLEITVTRPCYYIQAWCDGGTEGMSIKIGEQNRVAMPLSRFIIIPVFNPDKIYFTSDVRAGRTKLILYFVRTQSPLGMYLGGEGISREEQAARGGSIDVYDRRGEVIWYDDFEDGLMHWDTELSGTGAAVGLSVATALRGSTALRMTTGSDASVYAGVTRPIAVPKFVNAFGIESSWSCDADVTEAIFLLDAYTGSLVLHWGVRSVIATGQTSILTGAATWTNVDTGTIYPVFTDIKHFIQFKFVIDPVTLAYKRFLVAQLDIPVAPYTGYYGASAAYGHLQLTGRAIGVAASNAVAYADNFILTQNEPTD